MNSVTTLVVAVILALGMIVTAYGVFQATSDSADNSVFGGEGSFLDRAKNAETTEQSDYEKKDKTVKGGKPA